VKDRFLLSVISTEIAKYRMRLLELDSLLVHLDVKELADRLIQSEDNFVIDIIAFARQYISELIEQGRKGRAHPLLTVVNSLCDYLGSQKVEIDRINALMLPEYERYLKKERKFKRKNQFGNDVAYVFNIINNHYKMENKDQKHTVIAVQSHNPYPITEYLIDVRNGVWKNFGKNKLANSFRRSLQRSYRET